MEDVKPNLVKPDPGEAPKLQIRVKYQSGEPVTFVVKSSTPFSKVANAWGKQMSLDPKQFKFVDPEGSRIGSNSWDKTLSELGIEDEDTIDVFQEQIGGN